MKSFKEFMLGEAVSSQPKHKVKANEYYLVIVDSHGEVVYFYNIVDSYKSMAEAQKALAKAKDEDIGTVKIMLGKDAVKGSEEDYEVNEDLMMIKAKYADDVEQVLNDQGIQYTRKGNTFDISKKDKNAFNKILKDITKPVNEDAASIFAKIVNGQHYKDMIKEIEKLADEQSHDSDDYTRLVTNAIAKINTKLKSDFHL